MMKNNFDKVVVIGLGYIGLPTSAVLASRGINVLGVDVNASTVDSINAGISHIIEPDLDAVVRMTVGDGFLKAGLECESADAFIIAVPTPFKNAHEPDLSYIESATKMIAPHVKKGDLVILESTSPVGTTEQVAKWLSELRTDLHFPKKGASSADLSVCHCPERVLPGKILQEIVANDRIVGGITKSCGEKAKALYQIFVQGECIITDARTAELAKLSENAYRDTNIAFANELSMLCDDLDVDVWQLIKLANHHPRVNILQPGPGVGGHCIAVDPWFIVHSAPARTKLIKTARTVNLEKTNHIIKQVEKAIAGTNNPTVAFLGLSFKANVDDLRESPALDIATRISESLACMCYAVEPHIQSLPEGISSSHLKLVDLTEALEKSNIIVLLVDHRAFVELTLGEIRDKFLIDTRGMCRSTTDERNRIGKNP